MCSFSISSEMGFQFPVLHTLVFFFTAGFSFVTCCLFGARFIPGFEILFRFQFVRG